MTSDRPAERPSDRLARALGLPPLPRWTEEAEAQLDEELARVNRELAEMAVRRRSEAA